MLCETNQLLKKRMISPSNIFYEDGSCQTANQQLMNDLMFDAGTQQQYYLRRSLNLDPEVSRTPPHSELIKTKSQFQKKKRVQKLAFSEKVTQDPFQSTNKNQIRSRQSNFKSPKKTIKKFQIPQKIVKQINYKPKKVVSVTSDQKQLIVRNIFFRENRYYYSDQVVFSEILKRIYYYSWKFDDLRNYLQPSFKWIKNQTEFFKIIITEAKSFSLNVRNIIIKQIKKLLTNPVAKNQVWNFKKFNKNLRQYNHTIDCLHNHYKHLESVNQQIERLIHIYFSNFLKEEVELREEELKCHRKIFINYVYNDSLIRDFITTLYKFLDDNNRHSSYYQTSLQQIEEIYENLELHSEIYSDHPSDLYSTSQSTEVCTYNTCSHHNCNESFSEQNFGEEHKNYSYEGDYGSLKDQDEKKRQKRREKRKKRKAKKQKQKKEQQIIENKLLDQMLAEKLQKGLDGFSKEYKKEKFQKVEIKFQSQTSSYFDSLINSF